MMLSPDQLDRLERAGGDVGFNFQIAQFLITLSLSFLATLILSPPRPKEQKRTVFHEVIVVVGAILGPIFGIKCFQDRGAFQRVVNEIRELPEIGPLGDETQQPRPAELDQLPLGSAPAPAAAPALHAPHQQQCPLRQNQKRVNQNDYDRHIRPTHTKGLPRLLRGHKGARTARKWWHYMSSTWLLATTKSPQEVFDAVHAHLDKQDFLFIWRLTPNYQGIASEKAWEWIRSEFPAYNAFLAGLAALTNPAPDWYSTSAP